MQRVKTGIIGCGNISGIYLQNGPELKVIDIVACADIDLERAKATAETYAVKAYTVEEILQDPEIEIIINLTIPSAHASVSLAILEAGKHVYSEKPLAAELEDGSRILEMAEAKGLRVGCAPDTFLGGGIQTSRKLIDDGWIGDPVAATAFMMGGGHERWHPNPDYFYQQGGGPMFDMGPYYLTALVSLLGPVERIMSSTRKTLSERTISGANERYGEKIPVEVPTHITGILDFTGGAVGTMITSYDIFGASQLPRIEIYGTLGTISVPDPNMFDGPVKIHRNGAAGWSEVPLSHEFTGNSRGLGVADMARSIRMGRIHRANGALAYHVLESMHAFHIAAESERPYYLTSTCSRPEPLPVGFNRISLAADAEQKVNETV